MYISCSYIYIYLERCFPGCFFKQHTCTRCHGGSVALQQDGCSIQWTSSRLKGGLLHGRCEPGDSIQPIQSLCTCVVSRIAMAHTRGHITANSPGSLLLDTPGATWRWRWLPIVPRTAISPSTVLLLECQLDPFWRSPTHNS